MKKQLNVLLSAMAVFTLAFSYAPNASAFGCSKFSCSQTVPYCSDTAIIETGFFHQNKHTCKAFGSGWSSGKIISCSYWCTDLNAGFDCKCPK